jgi:hypothetical protein
MGPEQLSRLVDDFAAALVLYARQWCASAEDVVQEAFVKLASQRPPPDNIDAMPKAQVVLLWYVDQYDRAWDELSKALTVPAWEELPLLEAVFQEYRSTDNIFLRLLLPTINKTWLANRRFERQLAGLRCAEALRLYAATHEGKPPEKWSDLALRLDEYQIRALAAAHHVALGSNIGQLNGNMGYKVAMETCPQPARLNVGIHSRKW